MLRFEFSLQLYSSCDLSVSGLLRFTVIWHNISFGIS